MKSLFLLCLLVLFSQAQSLEERLLALKDFDKAFTQQTLSSLANPFTHPATSSHQALQLEAIINQKALINDQWLALNQSIQEYRLIRIESKSVTLQKGSSFITLPLYSPSQKPIR